MFCLWLLPPISSKCFNQFPPMFVPDAQIFWPERIFSGLSARQTCLPGRHICPADISARQTCLPGRHICPADISARQRCLWPTEMSLPDRDVSARQRCLCPTEMSLCMTEMSLPHRDVCARQRCLHGEENPKQRDAYSGPKNRRVVIKAHPEKWDNYSDTTLL